MSSIATRMLLNVLILGLSLVSACDNDAVDNSDDTRDASHSENSFVSPEIALLTHRHTVAYLSDKTWGYFGATCDQWLEIDYQWTAEESELLDDGRVSVVYARREERLLGPERLEFVVDLIEPKVQGRNRNQDAARSGISEGCDKW